MTSSDSLAIAQLVVLFISLDFPQPACRGLGSSTVKPPGLHPQPQETTGIMKATTLLSKLQSEAGAVQPLITEEIKDNGSCIVHQFSAGICLDWLSGQPFHASQKVSVVL